MKSNSRGYFNISYSSKDSKLGSSSYQYIMRLDKYSEKGGLVGYGFINTPTIYTNLQSDNKRSLEYYYKDFEKYSRSNSVISLNLIAMIPREFIDKYDENDRNKIYNDIGKDLCTEVLDRLSDNNKVHIGVYVVHDTISAKDNESQPHIHIQVSSHKYDKNILGNSNISSYELIKSGQTNSELQKKKYITI